MEHTQIVYEFICFDQMSFNFNTYAEYKKEFVNETKKVLKENISNNPSKLKEYETEITNAHNRVTNYIAKYFNSFNTKDKTFYRGELVYIRDKTNKCFGKLSSKIKVTTDLLQNLNDSLLTDDDSEIEENLDQTLMNSDTNATETTNDTDSASQNVINQFNLANSESNGNIPESIANETFDTMAPISVTEYYRMASQNINRNYGGDPLQLEPFVNSIKLLQTIDAEKTHLAMLKTFVISKLEGKALQIINKEDSLDTILATLQAKIKPDNSDVILGRMITLKLGNMTARNFAREAELLADAFHRSLILEGATLDMANKMTVKQTVKMCKNNAKSSHVKSVLDATTFREPKDVISKLITVQDEQDMERQVLSFHRHGNFRRGNNRFNNNGNFRNNNNSNQNFRQNNNNGYRGNGRGRGRGNNRSFGNNKRGNFNVRVSENLTGPPEQDGQTTFTLQNAGE